MPPWRLIEVGDLVTATEYANRCGLDSAAMCSDEELVKVGPGTNCSKRSNCHMNMFRREKRGFRTRWMTWRALARYAVDHVASVS